MVYKQYCKLTNKRKSFLELNSFLAEPVFRQTVHHAVLEAEAEVVHRLAQYCWRGPLGIEIGIAAGEGRDYR